MSQYLKISKRKFLLYKKRLNYCETFNYLANKAISDGCEFIFMVNNDTKNFSMDYFEQIISTFEDRQVGMVGSACLIMKIMTDIVLIN